MGNEVYRSLKSKSVGEIHSPETTLQEIFTYLEAAENNILQLQEIAYESTLSMLTAKQKQVLFAIAKEGYATNITSGAFVKKYHLTSASSLQTAFNALMDKSIVMRTDNGYRLKDFFFAKWLGKR